jgi:hypothetical protein
VASASSRVRELRDATWLALIPFGAAIVLGLLLLPRQAEPEIVPVPVVDHAALSRTIAADDELAEGARREALPGSVRQLGSAIRDFHMLEAREADAAHLAEARRAVDAAMAPAMAAGDAALLALRAAQLNGFLVEVHRFESTGEQSAELQALAGAFVRDMTTEGWCQGNKLAPRDAELRTMYKQMWNAFLGFQTRPGFELTLDELRVVYAFYLSQHHISRGMREALAAARRAARDEKACAALDQAAHLAVESWRLEHVKSLAAIDPAYPGDYALGVASYRHGDYRASVAAFRRWVQDHPDGPLALRARNFLRAAADAERVE